tara:strand:+ start:779 stop:1855 length:1077 start_codon:yes stop_codon:yes gene_type:complete
MPTITKSIGSGKDYSTIANWIVSLSDGTYDSGDDVIGELYDDSYDESFTFNDAPFATGGLSSVTLRANASEKHDGTPDSGVKVTYSGSVPDSVAPYNIIYDSGTHGIFKVRIQDIEFADFNNDNDDHVYGFHCHYNQNLVMSRCLINNFRSAALTTKAFRLIFGGSPRIQNCFIFNCGKTYETGGLSANVIAIYPNNTADAKIYNVTMHNIYDSSGNTVWGAFQGEYRNTTITNAGQCFRAVSGSSSSNNISSDSSVLGSNSLSLKSPEFLYVSTVAGSEDLHLIALAPALRKGVDLGTDYGVELDIDSYDRDASNSAWDIGGDQCDHCKTSSVKANSRLSLGFSANQAVSSFSLSEF